MAQLSKGLYSKLLSFVYSVGSPHILKIYIYIYIRNAKIYTKFGTNKFNFCNKFFNAKNVLPREEGFPHLVKDMTYFKCF